jgi:hypothetical protein
MGIVGFGVALALSFALMTRLSPGTPPWVPMRWAAVGRIGPGFVFPSWSLGAMPGLGGYALPHVASAVQLAREMDGAAGVSLAGLYLEWLCIRAPQRIATAAP